MNIYIYIYIDPFRLHQILNRSVHPCTLISIYEIGYCSFYKRVVAIVVYIFNFLSLNVLHSIIFNMPIHFVWYISSVNS